MPYNDDYADDISTTARLTTTAPVNGLIEISSDQDVFRINLTAGTAYAFNLVPTGSNLNLKNFDLLNLWLYNSSSQLIESDNNLFNGRDWNTKISYTPSISGDHYLMVNGLSWSIDAVIPYQLTVLANRAPVVTGKVVSTGIGQSIAATTLFSASDPDGDSITSYRFFDPDGSGYFEWSNDTGVSWDRSKHILTVQASALGNITYQVGTGTEAIGFAAYDGTLWSDWAYSTSTGTIFDDVANNTLRATDIFNTVGVGVEKAGMIRVLADFAKAAYSPQPWETASDDGKRINDPSPGADDAYDAIKSQKWKPLDLNPTLEPHTTLALTIGDNELSVENFTVTNLMSGGYYTNGNAAAFVAHSDDAIVISFRGTNDNGEGNNADVGNTIHPDKDQWGRPFDGSNQTMPDHYALLQPLINAVDSYISDSSNGINNVYVTGHSLGGAMAIQYMGTHSAPDYPSVTFAAVTFAAPGFGIASYDDKSRVTHIEINGDVVPDAGFHGGRTIHFEGNQTGEFIPGSDDNHPMDYYRQITKSIDPTSWMRILNESGDPDVFLGAQKVGSYFIVDGRDSGTGDAMPDYKNDTITDPLEHDYKVYYGGLGNDTLTGGSNNELMLGGPGDDSILGKGGADRLYGDEGNDTIDGGTGLDTSLYSSNRASYTVTKTSTGSTVSGGTDGRDTLTSIERLSFADGTLDFDTSGNSGVMYRLYKAALDRVPDLVGLGHNIRLVDDGLTQSQMADAFVRSAEFTNTYGALSNAQFINQLYLNVLDRTPDAPGLAHNLNLLNTTHTRADMLSGFSESAENQVAVIGQIQDGIWFT